jgi:molybdopterin molybdotransferase
MELLISVQRAREILDGEIVPLPPKTMKIQDAASLVLAQAVYAPADVPMFLQAGMDGYAFAFDPDQARYRIAGEVQAGPEHPMVLPKGTAVRIFTGAPVPEGADTVLMQEKAVIDDGYLVSNDAQLKQGNNVRPAGSEIRKGELVLEAGSVLNPVSIGVLASMGITEVSVCPRPDIAIIVTGNEVQVPGHPLSYGQVYDSSSSVLTTALSGLHAGQLKVHYVKDKLEAVKNLLDQCLQQADLVMVTGGVSVGDHDYTLKAFEACGVRLCFHKIRQKPGKPLLFGLKGHIAVFGLPGNPASVITCFYEYVYPALGKLMHKPMQLKTISLPLANDYVKPAGITHFLKARLVHQQVQILQGQDSYKLNMLAKADGFAVIPDTVEQINAGESVEVHLLPK